MSRILANVEENESAVDAEQSSPSQDSATPQEEGDRSPRQKELPNGVFVRNLVFDATEEQIAESFSQYGKVVSATLARDARGLSRGYAFVYFETPEEMQKVIEEANGTFWNGRRIHCAPRLKSAAFVERNKPMEERTPSRSLYIGNIPYEATDAELNKMFQALENVERVRIAVDRSTGWPRGFAHADFKDEQSALKAATHLKTVQLLGRNLRVDYSDTKPRKERSPTSYPRREE